MRIIFNGAQLLGLYPIATCGATRGHVALILGARGAFEVKWLDT